MGLFDRGTSYRLSDREPEKQKKKREVRPYKPPRPLSWLSCVILLLLSAALLGYGASLLLLRFGGADADALVNTRLNAAGEVEELELLGMTTTISYTFADAAGRLYGGTGSLFGNTVPVGDTIPVKYFPPLPGLHTLAFRTEDILTPCGALLLGGILIGTSVTRLRELFGRKRMEEDTSVPAANTKSE